MGKGETVAVTGASGHIGNVVCRTLLAQGYHVRAQYRSDRRALEGLSLETVQGDVTETSDLDRLFSGCHQVINCAGALSISGGQGGAVHRTNVIGAQNVLDAAVRAGVRRVVHISSVHAVHDLPHHAPYNESRPYKGSKDFAYDRSKAEGEQLMLRGAQRHPIEVVVVRPSAVVGPFDFKPSEMGSAILRMYRRPLPVVPPGGYNLVDVRDVAEAIVRAMELGKNAEVYLLSGQYCTVRELVRQVRALRRHDARPVVAPFWLLSGAVPLAWAYGRLSGKDNPLTYEALVALREGHPHMDHAKARLELDHAPRTLHESLSDFIAWVNSKDIAD
jgi:dihydroflavonol-4-reductase